MSIETFCNEGCQKPFTIKEMTTAKLQDDIEKICFACPHCQREYVAFYTDREMRQLQRKIRQTLAKKVNPRLNSTAAIRREREIVAQVEGQKGIIAEKMAALRKRVESNG